MLTATEAKKEIRRLHDELTALVGKLDHLDHDIACKVNEARDSLHQAWVIAWCEARL